MYLSRCNNGHSSRTYMALMEWHSMPPTPQVHTANKRRYWGLGFPSSGPEWTMDNDNEERPSDSDKCPLLHGGNTFHRNQYSYTSLGSVQGSSGDEDGSDSWVQGHRRGSDGGETVKVYTRRFYILAVFSLIAVVQGLVWNTWSPISQSAKRVFHWSDGDVALLANWGPITYVTSMVFFSWLLDVKGRFSISSPHEPM